MTYFLDDTGVLKSPSTTVLESFSVCLMKLGALTLGAHRLIIVISFWCIAPFISRNCPSSPCLIKVGLKSALSDITIDTPAYFQALFLWLGNSSSFHPKSVFIFVNKICLL
jgi:hypothetical protein